MKEVTVFLAIAFTIIITAALAVLIMPSKKRLDRIPPTPAAQRLIVASWFTAVVGQVVAPAILMTIGFLSGFALFGRELSAMESASSAAAIIAAFCIPPLAWVAVVIMGARRRAHDDRRPDAIWLIALGLIIPALEAWMLHSLYLQPRIDARIASRAYPSMTESEIASTYAHYLGPPIGTLIGALLVVSLLAFWARRMR